MTWRERIVAHAHRRSLPAVTVAEGVGVEFTDGCDVCWLLPGEVTSTVPVATAEPDVPALIAAFERIDRLRASVLHVLRHHLAGRRLFVDRRRSGEWSVMTEDGASSTISLGPSLTARAVDGLDVYQLVAACCENALLGKPPGRRRVDRYLATAGPPAGERSWPAEPPTIAGSHSLRSVLLLSGLCRAVEKDANLTSPAKLREALVPTGRLGQALLHLADRLPHVSASCDLADGSFALDFDDEEDSFCILRRSRDLARRVRALGVRAAGDQLADEYLKLNADRALVLSAVKRAAAGREWGVQRIGPFLLAPDVEATWYLGRTSREVELPVGPALTDLLPTVSPEEALRRLLASHPAFAEECVAALGKEGPPPTLPELDLAPAVPPRLPRLRELDADVVAELDAFAERTLAAYLLSDQALWDCRRSDRFDPRRDTWATAADWARLAERHLDGDWPDPAALLGLMDAGDPRGWERARSLLPRMEPHHEVSDAEVELVWRLRHEVPEIARKWFASRPFDSVPYAEPRARLGDPVARRYVLADEGFDVNDETTWGERANPALAGQQPNAVVRDRVRGRLLRWARTTWKWSPAQTDELRKALWLGLGEVADELEENPYLAHGLLCADRRDAQFDEPGVLLSGDFLLVWSQLRPTPLLARVVATAHTGDVLGEAERSAREEVERNPAHRTELATSLEIYRGWWQGLQVPLAIVWKRFRSSRGPGLAEKRQFTSGEGSERTGGP
jgi:hypothetical protein